MATAGIVHLRKRQNLRCVICSAWFYSYRTAMYCSNACKQRAKYRKMKENKLIKKGVDTDI